MELTSDSLGNIVSTYGTIFYRGSKGGTAIVLKWSTEPDIAIENLNVDVNITYPDGTMSGWQTMSLREGLTYKEYYYMLRAFDLNQEGIIYVNVRWYDSNDIVYTAGVATNISTICVSGIAKAVVKGGIIAQPAFISDTDVAALTSLVNSTNALSTKKYNVSSINTYSIPYEGNGYKVPNALYYNFSSTVTAYISNVTSSVTKTGTLLVLSHDDSSSVRTQTELFFADGKVFVRKLVINISNLSTTSNSGFQEILNLSDQAAYLINYVSQITAGNACLNKGNISWTDLNTLEMFALANVFVSIDNTPYTLRNKSLGNNIYLQTLENATGAYSRTANKNSASSYSWTYKVYDVNGVAAYDSSLTYDINSIVSSGSNLYQSLAASNTSALTDNSKWRVITNLLDSNSTANTITNLSNTVDNLSISTQSNTSAISDLEDSVDTIEATLDGLESALATLAVAYSEV